MCGSSLTVDLTDRQLDWRPEKKGEARKRHERVLIIQNMFHPSDFEVSKYLTHSLTHDHKELV